MAGIDGRADFDASKNHSSVLIHTARDRSIKRDFVDRGQSFDRYRYSRQIGYTRSRYFRTSFERNDDENDKKKIEMSPSFKFLLE